MNLQEAPEVQRVRDDAAEEGRPDDVRAELDIHSTTCAWCSILALEPVR